MWIDSHCHLNHLSEASRRDILSYTQAGSDYYFIDSGIDLETSLISSRLSGSNSQVYTTLGFHPLSGENFSQNIMETYESMVKKSKKIIGIGEIGLDYKASCGFKKQEEVFKAMIGLAKKYNLPITIHNRVDPETDKLASAQAALEILDEFYPDYRRAVFHCFSHPVQILEKIIDKGGFASFSLNILRKSKKILESLEACPLENIIFETDSPYMKIKDGYSTPLDIAKVYERAAEIKAVEIEKLEEQVFSNIKKVFSLTPAV